jgi:hypothetical protein
LTIQLVKKENNEIKIPFLENDLDFGFPKIKEKVQFL